jgi:hypothetical protein
MGTVVVDRTSGRHVGRFIDRATADSRPITVNLQLRRMLSAATHHAHVQLQEHESIGAWMDVPGGSPSTPTMSTAGNASHIPSARARLV